MVPAPRLLFGISFSYVLFSRELISFFSPYPLTQPLFFLLSGIK